MKLTDKQQQLVVKKLEKAIKVCPICGHKGLIISDTIFEIREFNGGQLILGGKESTIYPLIAVVCGGCGNTQFFNAILLGIVSNNDKSTTKETQNNEGEKE